jgi:hypothetical protein
MLHQFKYQESFIDYLREEHMNVELNNLECILPMQVGFFEFIVARNETMDLYAKRLQDILPKGAPKFQLNLSTIKAKHDRARVLMVSCKPNDLIIMENIMKNLVAAEKIHFHLWKFFHTMELDKKQTVILEQNKHNGDYRSHMLHGFIDEDEEICMIIEENSNNNKTKDKLSKTTVDDYLRNIRAGDGTPLFEIVYPTTLGCKEFITPFHHNEEAKEFLEIGLGEIARDMNEASRAKVFADPDAAFNESLGAKWEPYYRAREIESTNTYKNKRNRTDKDDDERMKTSYKSYAEIAAFQKIESTPTTKLMTTTITKPVQTHRITNTITPFIVNKTSNNVTSPSPTEVSTLTNNIENEAIKQMQSEMEAF